MAPTGYVLNALRKKHRLPPPPGFDPNPGYTASLGAHQANLANYNAGLPGWWQNIINSDPILGQDLANILGDSIADRAQVQGGLRQALARYGGGAALRGIMGQLGAQPGFEDLVDETTIGAAAAGDQAGTTLLAQLDKAHRDRLLAEEDIRAAKGLGRSGQVGYELGEARQADTINRSEAINQLMDFLRGGIGDYASRERARNAAQSAARANAAGRVADLGLEPPPPPVAPPAPPPDTPAMLQQLIRNSKRPPRRAIGGWDF